jgi:hypothetical protein
MSNKVVLMRKPIAKMSSQEFCRYLIDNKDKLIAYGSVDGNTIDGAFVGWKISETRYPLNQNYKVSWQHPVTEAVQHFYISDFRKLVEAGNLVLEIVK